MLTVVTCRRCLRAEGEEECVLGASFTLLRRLLTRFYRLHGGRFQVFRLRTSSKLINRFRNLLASFLATAPLKDLVAAEDATALTSLQAFGLYVL